MACFSCFSGLFFSARHSDAAKQPEKLKEDPGAVVGGAVHEELALAEPAEAAGAPADKEMCNEAEADPERPAAQSPGIQPTEPEAAAEPAAEAATAPAHFEGSDAEDGATGKAAKGCCVPRAGRRRNKSAKAVKHEAQEATPKEADSAHDGSPGITGRTTASAGA